MADGVQEFVEGMVSELNLLEKKGVFRKSEVKRIVKRRTHFEYQVRQRRPRRLDFLRYLQYEMDLEKLRSTRMRRIGVAAKPSIIEHGGVRRIHFLFQRALRRFPSDVNLWLKYLQYCFKHDSQRAVNRILMRALQLNPSCTQLWIVAAAWESQHNGNFAAARAHMLRALRLNSLSCELWIEYFRLELIYLDRILSRSAVLRGETAPTEGEDELMEPQNETTNQRMDGDSKLRCSFLECGIPRTIFTNAIETLPNDLNLRLEFLRVYQEFEGTQQAQQEVVDTIIRDFPVNPGAHSAVAQWMLHEKGRDSALSAFHQAARESKNMALWEAYVAFVGEVYEEQDESASCVLAACQQAESEGFTSVLLTEKGVGTLLHLGRDDEALDLLVQSTRAGHVCERDPSTWLKRIALFQRSGQNVSPEAIRSLYSQALSLVRPDDSCFLWKEYIGSLCSDERSGFDSVLSIFDRAIGSLYSCCLPASSASDCDAHSTAEGQIHALRRASMKMISSRFGILEVRKFYHRALQLPCSASFYGQCIAFEEDHLRKMGLRDDECRDRIRHLFESALTENRHGRASSELWMKWVVFERTCGRMDVASRISERATRTLLDPRPFVDAIRQ